MEAWVYPNCFRFACWYHISHSEYTWLYLMELSLHLSRPFHVVCYAANFLGGIHVCELHVLIVFKCVQWWWLQVLVARDVVWFVFSSVMPLGVPTADDFLVSGKNLEGGQVTLLLEWPWWMWWRNQVSDSMQHMLTHAPMCVPYIYVYVTCKPAIPFYMQASLSSCMSAFSGRVNISGCMWLVSGTDF